MSNNFKKKQFKETGFSKLMLLVVSLVLILAGIQLVISHQLATAGSKIRGLEEETERLKRANSVLAEQINRVGSLSEISAKAGELGLVRTSRVVHLTSQLPVALKL